MGNDSLSFLNALVGCNFEIKSDFVVDLRSVTFITPVALTMAGIAQKFDCELHYPSNNKARSYLEYMLNPFGMDDTRYVPFFWCSDSDDATIVTRKFNSLLYQYSGPSTETVKYAMHEMIDNIHNHAYSKHGFCVQAQRYPTDGKIEIAVADLGIGIDRSLRLNPDYALMDNNECFQLAIELGRSSTPERNSGEGLSSIIEFIVANTDIGSRLVILSNNHYLSCREDIGIVFGHLQYRIWPGTFIWASIPDEPRKTLKEVWDMLGKNSE